MIVHPLAISQSLSLVNPVIRQWTHELSRHCPQIKGIHGLEVGAYPDQGRTSFLLPPAVHTANRRLCICWYGTISHRDLSVTLLQFSYIMSVVSLMRYHFILKWTDMYSVWASSFPISCVSLWTTTKISDLRARNSIHYPPLKGTFALQLFFDIVCYLWRLL